MVHDQSEKMIRLLCNYYDTLSAESLNSNAVLHASSRSAVVITTLRQSAVLIRNMPVHYQTIRYVGL